MFGFYKKGLELFWEQAPVVEEDDEKVKEQLLENEALTKVYFLHILCAWLTCHMFPQPNVWKHMGDYIP
jgi:hypothetical protein